jgi:hypothetical protein
MSTPCPVCEGGARVPPKFRVLRAITGLALWVCIGFSAWAGEEDEIITGCHYSNAEWGAEMIDRCIKENQATRKLVLDYPARYQRIVDRCRQGNEYGWSWVKTCVDQDIAAEAALAHYPEQHAELIADCQAEFGHRGAAAVKACADKTGATPSAPAAR